MATVITLSILSMTLRVNLSSVYTTRQQGTCSLELFALLEMPFDFRASPPYRLELLTREQCELVGPVS
jgi:hypothetical protein